MGDTVFIKTKDEVTETTGNAQARNRLWWERMPMSYVDWEDTERLPESGDALRDMEQAVLSGSPFLSTQFDFSQFAGQRVLDVGCGSGIFSCLLAKGGAEVTAMDLTEAGVQMTRQNAAAQELSLSIVRTDAENMAFADGTFDFMFSWGVLHHTRDMDKAFREVSRILKPGAHGMLMVYHRNSIVYYLHGLFWLLFKGKIFAGHNFESVQDFYTDGYYHRYLSAKELHARLKDAGLQANQFHITQYKKKILPLIPKGLDTFLKSRFGMCLVCEFSKS